MRIKNNLLFFVFFLLAFPIWIHSQSIKEFLDKIPPEEKEELTQLFYSMMHDDHLAYTLFGDKPVSLSSEFTITPLQNILCRMTCGSIFWKRWEIWEKYKNNLPLTHYLLIQENHPYRSVGSVFLINKSAFVKTVNEHIALFKKILGPNVNGEELLEQVEKQQKFSPVIQNNVLLLGILLGYGVHNAKLFAKKDRVFLFVVDEMMPFQEKLPQLPLKAPLPSKGFSSIEEEYAFLKSHLKPFGDYDYSLLTMQSVHFMADPEHAETKDLKQKYQELRSKISAIYAQGNFLEITLNQLISH